VRRVSIVSRGQAGGYTMIVPDEDRGLWTRQQLTDRLAALLGGFAAEEIVFGDVTTGSSNDLERVSSITLSMVSRYGMGETFGLLSTGDDDSRFGFSQRTAFAAESEARTIVDTARDLARSVLITHRSDLERLADYLLEHETVEGDELVAMFGPATTAAPRPKLPVPLPAMSPVGVARPPQQGRRRRVVETLITSPATVVASIRLARRRRLLE
jgi:cell division protease FtsH